MEREEWNICCYVVGRKKKDEKDFVKEINKKEVKRSSSLLKAIQIYIYYIYTYACRERNE